MDAKLFIFAAVAISEVFSACKPTKTKFTNFKSEAKRSIPFEVGVSMTKCPGLNEFYYQFTVLELFTFRPVQTSTKPTIFIDGYKYDSEKCYKTLYLLRVKVSHYPDMSYFDQKDQTFTFAPDQMHVEIVGGLQKGHQFGYDLTIDAKTLSRDTSYPPNEDAFAGDVIYWEVEPEIEGYTLPEELLITIPAKFLKLHVVYLFQVNVTRTKIKYFYDTQTAFQRVLVLPYAPPEINIKCIRNCIAPHINEPTAFIIECTNYCNEPNYTWYVNPPPKKWQMDFGTGHDKLVIEGGTFNEGDKVFVSVIVQDIPFLKTITFAQGLKKGRCSIHPKRGISAITKFRIYCTGFSSPYGLSLCMIYQNIGKEKVLLKEYSFKTESQVYLPAGRPVILSVVVEDHAFLRKEVILRVQVERYRPNEGMAITSSLKKLVISRKSKSITTYSLEGFYNEVVQLINCVLLIIKRLGFKEATARDLHKHMAEAILRSKPVRLTSAIQRLLILCRMEKFKIKTDSVTSNLMGQALRDTILNTHLMFNHKQNSLIPQFYIDLVFQLSLQLSSELLLENDEILNVLNHEAPPHEYDSYDELVSKKVQIRDDYRSLTNNILIALQTNCLTVLFKSLPDESAYKYEAEMVAVQAKRKELSSFNGSEHALTFETVTDSKIILPPKLIKNLYHTYNYVDLQFAVFKRNPFWWHQNASSLNTYVTLFDLFDHCRKIKKLTEPFLIELEIVSLPKEVIKGALTNKSFAAYKVELEPNVTLVVEFFSEGEHPNDYLVTWSDCVCTEDDFSSARSKFISGGKNHTKRERTMRVENKKGAKNVYICVKKSTPKLSYRIILASFSCMYWDLLDEKWSREGCKIIEPFITPNKSMICKCNHVSVFAGEILAPQTTLIVDLEVDFSIAFTQNYVMVAFISGLLLLWLVSLALAHLKDKSMKKNNVVYKLDDNVPGDSNPYLVVVFTGIFFDAQTTADVSLKLIGKLSQSRAHVIKCQGTTLLKRNSQDWFMLYTPHYLGELQKIQLWHNSKGRYPHWYCDRIIVQDMKIGEQYCFTVKKWFSVIWGSGRIYREIRVNKAKMKNILFRTQFERGIKDKHIWMSVLSRDIQSNFNSKERVSTGFCFLFLSMLANALLYGLPEGIPADSVDEQTTFSVTLSNVFIFIASWMLATPFSFLIIYIFKNSAPL